MEEQLIYIIMLISIALSALCSTLEATLLSTPLSYIAGLEDQGVKGAKRLKRLKTNSDRPISAILCLNTIANTVGASIVGSLVYEVYGDALVGVFSTIFTLCILILSDKLLAYTGHPGIGDYRRHDFHLLPLGMGVGAPAAPHLLEVEPGERKP